MISALRGEAAALGFGLCKITSPDSIPAAPARLEAWLAQGAQGHMNWMTETRARRADPRALWPDVRSIIMLGVNYGPDGDALAGLDARGAGNISVYARHRDYHDVIKGRLKQLASWFAAQRAGAEVKVFVDTAPVMEKPLAEAAGLGWQGKHTNLVSRDFGSWLFLGSIFTDAELAPDAPDADHCGACRACLDICPTQAFPAPYQLDARRCISYLTIELKGHIPKEFRAKMGNRIYGCDDCLAVCPWNKFARSAREMKLRARADLIAPELRMLAGLDDAAFRKLFSGSPVKRIGHARFIRNVMTAAGNSGDAGFEDVIAARLGDASPLIRLAAVWAAGRVLAPARLAALAGAHLPRESDVDVRGEWSDALAGRGVTQGPDL